MSALTIQYGHADELTRSAAAELTGRLRAALRNAAQWAATAQELIQEAWAMRADIALRYETWETYCEDVFAGVRDMRLPVETRRAIVDELREQGMSLRAIAAPLGIAEGTVRGDLRAIGSSHDAPVAGIDGRSYQAREAKTAAPKPVRQKTDLALESLGDAGATGLTIAELMKKRRWSYTQASATLSRLHRQADEHGRRKVECLDQRRGGYSVYVHPDHVEGRETKAPGRTRTTATA